MKWELHAHTAQGSRCGKIDAADVVARQACAGYGGVVITDHYNNDNVDARPGTPRDRARTWMEGYLLARAAGE